MGFLKIFAKDMVGAGKTAARGMGNLADQFSEDPKVRKRAIAERKKMDAEQREGAPKIPKSVTYNKCRYTLGGTFGSNLTQAKRYAVALEENNGFKTVIKKIQTATFGTVYAVYYTTKQARKAVKGTVARKAKPRKAKKIIKAKKSRSDDGW